VLKMKVCIVGASGKLGQFMVQHALDRGYEAVGACRQRSVEELVKRAVCARRAQKVGFLGSVSSAQP
jgi:putative NADH-flavin reductase